jgi:hypothetical protein
MDATFDASVLRLSTESSAIHAFPGGALTATYRDSGSVTGTGDLLLRTKYRITPLSAVTGLAAGIDLRLPTGSAEDLLGTGTTTATFNLMGSSTYGRLSPHLNLGFSVSGDGEVVFVPNEFGYRLGTDYVLSPRATLAVDLLGRSLLGSGKLDFGNTDYSYRISTGATRTTTIRELQYADGTINLTMIALGGKFNVAESLLVNANVLVAATSRGVTARITPVVGFDYSF